VERKYFLVFGGCLSRFLIMQKNKSMMLH
jgi:hypothetical protein